MRGGGLRATLVQVTRPPPLIPPPAIAGGGRVSVFMGLAKPPARKKDRRHDGRRLKGDKVVTSMITGICVSAGQQMTATKQRLIPVY